MTLTLLTKSIVIKGTETDTALTAAVQAMGTFSHVYGVSILPVSNTQFKIVIVYD